MLIVARTKELNSSIGCWQETADGTDCRRFGGGCSDRDLDTVHWWSSFDNVRFHPREERSRSRDLRLSSTINARCCYRPNDRVRLDIRASWASSSVTHSIDCNPTRDVPASSTVVRIQVLRWSRAFPLDRGDRWLTVERSDRSPDRFPVGFEWSGRSFLEIDANKSAECRHTSWFRLESSHWPTRACSMNEPTRYLHCFQIDQWTKSHRMTRDGTNQ